MNAARSPKFFSASCREPAYSCVLWGGDNGDTTMLYAILCYNDEAVVESWPQEEIDAVIAKRAVVTKKLAAQGKLGPVVRLMPTTAATTIRSGREPLILDGPFAETKEQLLGFYIIDCATLEEAIATASE